MQRREWFKVLAGGLMLSALGSAASAEAVRRIGLLIINDGYENEWEALFARLAFYGWVDGENMQIVYAHAKNDFSKIPQLVKGLIDSKVELIAAQATQGAMRASEVSLQTPIVGVGMFDPVAAGAVSSLAHSGGHITGTSFLSNDITLKTLELIKLILPEAKTIAILIHPQGSMRNYLVDVFDKYSPNLGFRNTNFFPSTASELATAFDNITARHLDAVVIGQHPFFVERRSQLADLGVRYKLPIFAQWARYVESGILASYGNDITQSYIDTAKFIDQILRGRLIANMPIEQSSAYETAINLNTADKLGITISGELQLRANKLIQ